LIINRDEWTEVENGWVFRGVNSTSVYGICPTSRDWREERDSFVPHLFFGGTMKKIFRMSEGAYIFGDLGSELGEGSD